MARQGVFISESFRRFWRADAVSGLGTYVTLFALQALVVLTLHGSAGDVGWLNAARWLPYLVIGLVVGAIVDGRRRLPILIATDFVQAGLLLSIPLMWWFDLLSLPVLLVIVMAYGTAAVVNTAAGMSFLPRLIEPRHLQRAHARLDGADAVSSTAGPALGGVLVSLIGAPLAVLVDSASYIFSAMTLRRIEIDEPPPRKGVTAHQLVGEVAEGVRWVYRGSGLRALALAVHTWFIGHAIMGVILAPYVLRTLDLSAFQFGLVGAAGGIGAVVGASVTTWAGRKVGTGWIIILTHATMGIGAIVLTLAGQRMSGVATVTAVMVGQGLYGLSMGMTNSHEMSYRQLVTPDGLQARTNTTMRSINRTVIVIVAPIVGVLADRWGNRSMLVVAAVVFVGVSVALGATSFRTVRAPS